MKQTQLRSIPTVSNMVLFCMHMVALGLAAVSFAVVEALLLWASGNMSAQVALESMNYAGGALLGILVLAIGASVAETVHDPGARVFGKRFFFLDGGQL